MSSTLTAQNSVDQALKAAQSATERTMRQAGYPKAARAEVVRAALQELHHVLAGRTRAEVVKFFLDREADRLLASFHGTPRLPFP
jgi:hypothetical protein